MKFNFRIEKFKDATGVSIAETLEMESVSSGTQKMRWRKRLYLEEN